MATPVESIVRAVLAKKDRGAKLLAAMQFGWSCRGLYPGNENWRRKTTRAHLVWEDTVKKAVELFDDDVGVTIISHHDTVSFIFDDAVLLRFKKADTTLKSSNVQTALSGLFHEHEADLFGYTGLQRVEACYVLNKFETQIVWSGIVARESDANLWHFELTEPTAPATAEVLEFPPMSATDPSDLAKVKESVEKPADEKKDSE